MHFKLAVLKLKINCIHYNFSFVSEHIETLEEIDMEYKHLALESGIENWGRVPALNCTSSFINDLADAVIEALPSTMAISNPSNFSEGNEDDPVKYAIKMFFGSILAFVLALFPKYGTRIQESSPLKVEKKL